MWLKIVEDLRPRNGLRKHAHDVEKSEVRWWRERLHAVCKCVNFIFATFISWKIQANSLLLKDQFKATSVKDFFSLHYTLYHIIYYNQNLCDSTPKS